MVQTNLINIYTNFIYNLFLNKNITSKHILSESNNRVIDTLFVIQSQNDLFVSNPNKKNKDFYTSYWNTFLKKFYFKFTKINSLIGILALPSQKN